MAISLLHPGYLLVLLLAIGVWVGPWRSAKAGQGVFRTLLIAALAIALARPVVVRDGAAPTRVWVLDGSASVDPGELSAARDAIARMVVEDDARNVLISIGAPPDDELARIVDRVTTIASADVDGASPLSAALAQAAAEIPAAATGSVTLLTDGLATRPDDGRALQALRERAIPVHVAPLSMRRDEVRPVGLTWRGELRVGETARLVAIVAGRGDGGRVVLADETGEVAGAEFDAFDGRAEIALAFEPKTAGFHEMELRVDAPGDDLACVLPVQDPRRVLYIGDRQRDGAERLSELLGDGFEVTGGAADPEALRKADLVMLDDVPADRVPDSVQRSIRSSVADEGLGLVMSGGRAAFSAGGWHDTPIETVLPVELVQKEEKRDPSTTLVVVIDTSGSMGGQRVQLAKEVARLAIQRLMPHDKVGIVEFYGAKRWAAPIQPASNRIEIERALNRLDAGGGTVILPAIEESFYGLQNIDTRYKHVLVLTDGGVEAGAFEPLLRRMADEGINVTTVLTGGGIHSEFLVNIANWGKGRFYSVPDRFNLPELIFKQPSSAKLPSYRQGTHSVRARGGRGWWGDVDPTTVPDLAGYVETRSRPGAEVLLETMQGSHPVVATWRWGLGRVTSMGTEPVGEGTGPWRSWEDYGRSLARMLERTAADGRTAFEFSVTADGADLVVTATRLVPETPGLAPKLTDVKRFGWKDLPMEQRSPDRWVARLLSPPMGETLHLVGSDTRLDTAGAQRLIGPSTVVDEMHVDPARGLDLEAVAAVTGGRILAVADPATRCPPTSDHAGLRVRPLAPWLLVAVLGLFLGELTWRRRP